MKKLKKERVKKFEKINYDVAKNKEEIKFIFPTIVVCYIELEIFVVFFCLKDTEAQ